MKKSLRNIFALMAMTACVTGNADDFGRLFVIGDASPAGWNEYKCQALLATPEDPDVYTGTLYLKNSGEFKFMTQPTWGSLEYGVPAGASSTVDGSFAIASGKDDEGYSKLSVAQAGNYLIKVDTKNLTADITLSPYQASEIIYSSLFLVGGNTPGGWSVDDGTPLYQTPATPYIYSAKVELKGSGSFKIATSIRGGGTYSAEHFLFRDAANPGKISSDDTGDLQWSVEKDDTYNVIVNTVDSTISITSTTSVEGPEVNDDMLPSTYYNLQGQKVANPEKGIYIKVTGDKASKIIL